MRKSVTHPAGLNCYLCCRLHKHWLRSGEGHSEKEFKFLSWRTLTRREPTVMGSISEPFARRPLSARDRYEEPLRSAWYF